MRLLAATCRVICLIVCVYACGCGTQPANSNASAAADRSDKDSAKSPTNSSTPNGGVSEATRGAGLREAIVGKWIEVGMSDNPETLEFSADGKFARWAISTQYSGTYVVLDEQTLEIQSASVLSEMRLRTERLEVTLAQDTLKIVGRASLGFRRDKPVHPAQLEAKPNDEESRRKLARLLLGKWREATFSERAETLVFSETGQLTFSGPPLNIANYRVLDANMIEVNRTASAFVPPEKWTVIVSDRTLEIQGQSRSYLREGDPTDEPKKTLDQGGQQPEK